MRNGSLDCFLPAKTLCVARTTNMHPLPDRRDAMACDALASREAVLVLEQARSLQRAAAAGALPASLRGRQFGFLCEAADSGDAALFRRVAVELGAQIAHIPTRTGCAPRAAKPRCGSPRLSTFVTSAAQRAPSRAKRSSMRTEPGAQWTHP